MGWFAWSDDGVLCESDLEVKGEEMVVLMVQGRRLHAALRHLPMLSDGVGEGRCDSPPLLVWARRVVRVRVITKLNVMMCRVLLAEQHWTSCSTYYV